jgi:hypothetical protein
MPILGPHSLLDTVLPAGIDASYVLNFQSADGLSATDIIALAATTIGEANTAIVNFYSGIITLTEELYATSEIGDGTRTMTPRGAEFVPGDGVVGEELAHMLFINKYTDAVSWSVDFLKKARRSRIVSSLNLIANRWRNRVDRDVVWRLLSAEEVLVGRSGFAPGWAIGTGTNSNFIPPQWMTETFDSTHTHYSRTNAAASAANVLAAIEEGAEEVGHHGHTGDKVAFVAGNLAKLLTASNDKRIALYVPERFRIVGGNANAQIVSVAGTVDGVPGEVVAYVNTDNGVVEVRRHPRFPTGYGWVGKGYGAEDMRNPLAIRTDPDFGGFGLTVQPQVDRSLQPRLESIQFDAWHGVNVNDRTNGFAFQIASGSDDYANPVIAE